MAQDKDHRNGPVKQFHFEANLDYQLQAIESVCGLFQGQELCRTTEFTLSKPVASPQMGLPIEPSMEESALGIGNRLTLLDDQVLGNLQKRSVQLRWS